MGLFDGKSGGGELASTAHVAKLLDAPVLLVVDASGMARSVAAAVHGYATFDPDLRVAGVVLNRVGSDWHEEILREALAPLGLPVLGVLRRDDGARHARAPPRARAHRRAPRRGARPRDRRRSARRWPSGSTSTRAGARPRRRGRCRRDPWSPGSARPSRRAGRRRAPPGRAPSGSPLARGAAFSFLYPENVELLEAAGAEVVFFDPLADERLPDGTDALYLGGGFPEVYADELAANGPLRADVVRLARSGRAGDRRVRRAHVPGARARRAADVRGDRRLACA